MSIGNQGLENGSWAQKNLRLGKRAKKLSYGATESVSENSD